ncbi:hypothetical protein ABW20_dc0109552 [Dactylellina cionopaga]|nr:hypothetical protein ABW20_dc0109552 [Dactylellina cionopaga]
MSHSLLNDYTIKITGWAQDGSQLVATAPEPLRSPALTYKGLSADTVNGLPAVLPYCLRWIDGDLDGRELLTEMIALLARADDELRRVARVAATLALAVSIKDYGPGGSATYMFPLINFETDSAKDSLGPTAFKTALSDLMNVSTHIEETTGNILSEMIGWHLCGNATRVAYATLLFEYNESTARREHIIGQVRKGCADMLKSGIPPAVVFGCANLDLISAVISAALDRALAMHPSRADICTKAWDCIPLEEALLYRSCTGVCGWARHVEHCSAGLALECTDHMYNFGILIAAMDSTDIAKDHGTTFENIAAAYPEVDFRMRAHQLAKESSCTFVTLGFLPAIVWQFFAHSHSAYTSPKLLRDFLLSLEPTHLSDGTGWRRATVKLLENGSLPGYVGPLGLPPTLAVGSRVYIWDDVRLYYRPNDFTPPPFSDSCVDGWEDRLQRALAGFDSADHVDPESR